LLFQPTSMRKSVTTFSSPTLKMKSLHATSLARFKERKK
jgi:hypothetical protein